MKITIPKEHIAGYIKKAASIIPSRGAQHLQALWLRAESGELSIMSTDGSVEYVATCQANVETPGLIGAAGKVLSELVARFPSGDISLFLDSEGKSLRVQQGRRKYAVPIIDVIWFAGFEPFSQHGCVLWSGDFVREVVERVSFCISDDKDGEALECLCFTARKGGVEACGLNGSMFAMRNFVNDDLCAAILSVPKGHDDYATLLLQKRHMQEMYKWLPNGEIEMAINSKHVCTRTADGREMLRVPRATYSYPDYQMFLHKINEENNSRLWVDRKDFLGALDRMGLFNSVENRSVCLGFTPKNMSIYTTTVNDVIEEIDVSYDGALQSIAFPTRQLIEILNHFVSERVCLLLTEQTGPCAVTGEDDADYLVIIMPMKVVEDAYYEEKSGDV